MPGSLKGPQAKVEWANKHVRDFEAATAGLVISKTTHPHVIVTEDDPETGNLLYKLALVPDVPDEVIFIAADAIHNLRSSFDLLMTQLVERAENMPADRKTPYFPFGDGRESFEARLTPKVEALIGKDAVECLRATEAYRGGKGEAAWYLHHLDVEDKHRVIYALGFNFSSLTLPFPTPTFEGMDPAELAEMTTTLGQMMDEVFWKTSVPMFPLKAGDVLFSGPQNPTNDPKFRLDVAFAQPEFVEAQPVLPALTQYAQATEALVNSFAPLF